MFDVSKIGLYLSFRRKETKMTQGQLAEKLGVSHQAVSNWERGEAMPDIALLSKLARVLNTSIDGILLSGEQDSNTVQNSMDSSQSTITQAEPDKNSENKCDPYNSGLSDTICNKLLQTSANVSNHRESIEQNKVEIAELSNIMRTLKQQIMSTKSQSAIDKLQELIDEVQDQIDEIQDDIDELQDEIDEIQNDINEEQDVCNNINNADIDMESLNWKHITSIAPFASRATLDSLVFKLEEKADYNKIMKLAPFISSETIHRLILKAFEDGQAVNWNIITGLAPFSSRSTLDFLVTKLTEKADFGKIIKLAPFLSSETIEKLILTAFNDGNNPCWDSVVSLAPFTSSRVLEMLVDKLDEKVDFNKIMSIAPFLGNKTIDRLIMGNQKPEK